ncbi:hypothetical protein BDN72DRAFT_906275 [Pluteus cervinus]|uniref:Uncharacterized protein n=1 Tax=Pluteus cervinus TaxID=181527 RepID=A0ACD2ZZU9_9AGAR|nr:hypothetical protein BDN72DRAFT_906275 [Pluteus cervinus]
MTSCCPVAKSLKNLWDGKRHSPPFVNDCGSSVNSPTHPKPLGGSFTLPPGTKLDPPTRSSPCRPCQHKRLGNTPQSTLQLTLPMHAFWPLSGPFERSTSHNAIPFLSTSTDSPTSLDYSNASPPTTSSRSSRDPSTSRWLYAMTSCYPVTKSLENLWDEKRHSPPFVDDRGSNVNSPPTPSC